MKLVISSQLKVGAKRLLYHGIPFLLAALLLLPLAIYQRPSIAEIRVEVFRVGVHPAKIDVLSNIQAQQVQLNIYDYIEFPTAGIKDESFDGFSSGGATKIVAGDTANSRLKLSHDESASSFCKKNTIALDGDIFPVAFSIESIRSGASTHVLERSSDGDLRLSIASSVEGKIVGGIEVKDRYKLYFECGDCNTIPPIGDATARTRRGRIESESFVVGNFSSGSRGLDLTLTPVTCEQKFIAHSFLLAKVPDFLYLDDRGRVLTTINGPGSIKFKDFPRSDPLSSGHSLKLSLPMDTYNPISKFLSWLFGSKHLPLKISNLSLTENGISLILHGTFDSIKTSDGGYEKDLIPKYLEYFFLIKDWSWLLYISVVMSIGGLLYGIRKVTRPSSGTHE